MDQPNNVPIVPTIDAPSTPLQKEAAAYPVEQQQKAYDLFLKESSDFTDIALELAVPKGIVAAWARMGNWIEHKKEIQRAHMMVADAEFNDFRASERLPEAQKQLKITRDLEKLIEAAIEVQMEAAKGPAGTIKTMDIKRLAEALQTATGVSARAVGISEKSEVITVNEGGPGGGAGPQPIIIVGSQATPVVPISPDPINIDAKEVNDDE